MLIRAIPSLDVAGYQPHSLHGDGCTWVERNCYVDVCIELLHALGLEPRAAMAPTVAIDFEGDNFTFFKPSHDELRALYGIDVQELNVWRPLLDHAVEHLGAGRLIATETDSYWLPDTAGTDYRRAHVKTTIILAEVDVDARRAGYFHNTGYHALDGEDFDRLFRVHATPQDDVLPLFAEVIKIDRLVRRAPTELAAIARGFLLQHVERRASGNPVRRFASRTERDLATLHERGLSYYHAWAFGTIRQLGVSCELLAAHLRWIVAVTGDDELLLRAASDIEGVSSGAKSLILKAARAVNGRRALQAGDVFGEMSDRWESAMATLAALTPTLVPAS